MKTLDQSADAFDVEGLLAAQRARFEAAWERLCRAQPKRKIKSLRLRMRVATHDHAQSADAGRIYRVTGTWGEKTVTYAKQPKRGDAVGTIGKVGNGELFERKLAVAGPRLKELSLALVPTSTDGGGYMSRESGQGPELVVELVGKR